jgi:DNA-binding transcriptional ArsR family regulator
MPYLVVVQARRNHCNIPPGPGTPLKSELSPDRVPIVAILKLATSTVSRHISILQQARLVDSRKEGGCRNR